jgi:DNA polymerase-1
MVEDESYVLLTIDMAGAELRILAEMANEKIWIDAFNAGQDVHCICCELVDPEQWKALEVVGCKYFELDDTGAPLKKKCKCPAHDEKRNDFKPVNFGIAYGLGPRALSAQIKKPEDVCKDILKLHRAALPILWAYIDLSGQVAIDRLKAFDLFGRRELFKAPSYEDAAKYVVDHKDDDKPPNLKTALRALYGMIERAGKNMPIQSCNASILKLAMGSGSDENGKEFLWHMLPKYGARLIAMVHDELKIRCLKSNAEEVAILTEDAIMRAGERHLKKLKMTAEYVIGETWAKP